MSMIDSSFHIEVAVALPVHGSFSYSVPEALQTLATAGKRVLVPFGGRRVTGYVLGADPATPPTKILPVMDVLDDEPLFPESMIPLYRWVAAYYLHPLGEVIRTALPGGLNVRDQRTLALTDAGRLAVSSGQVPADAGALMALLADGPAEMNALARKLSFSGIRALAMTLVKRGWVAENRRLSGGGVRPQTERWVALPDDPTLNDKLSAPRRSILDRVAAEGPMPVRILAQTVPTAVSLVRVMEKSGQLAVFQQQVYRDPLGEPVASDLPHVLNEEQAVVVAAVEAAMGDRFETFLLHGVTGSGKTEVYMQLARSVIDRGGRVLVLVPEIALISQMARRFRARFGTGIALLHSALSRGERYDQWLRVMRGEATIAIGARSAIFAPFTTLDLVIVDEEHDGSYKQEGGLRYNARDLAVVRGRQNRAVVILGTATPSVQSFANARSGKFKTLCLTRRVEKRPMPAITVVDLTQSRDARGLRRFMTPELTDAMTRTLARGEQVLLFLNRRGFAGYPVCADCGKALNCRHCDISLTLHQSANAYRCHYCGFSLPSVTPCPACGGKRMRNLGLGTEKVASAVSALFPEARVARMDRDTTMRRGAVVSLLKRLHKRDIDVLVGTQMVAKGHDFPNITLVGVICADLSLNFPDFRAGERTFQLLAQVAGRAGRGDAPGRVVLQTYNPSHFSIQSATDQDFPGFYKKEVAYRQELGYPPFSRLVLLRISGKDAARTRDHAQELGSCCHRLATQQGGHTVVLGPIEAALSRVAGRYRWQVLLKSDPAMPVHRFLREVISAHSALFTHSAVRVAVDVDPFVFM